MTVFCFCGCSVVNIYLFIHKSLGMNNFMKIKIMVGWVWVLIFMSVLKCHSLKIPVT